MVKAKMLKEMRKVIHKADRVPDLAALVKDPAADAYQLAWGSPSLDDCSKLFQANMTDLYKQSSWGLDLEDKKEELSHSKARFVSLRAEGGALAAFLHFRFVMDDDENPSCVVLYVYELQIDKEHQRKGLGRRLMCLVEQLAAATNMTKVVLTVFRANKGAMEFYEKLGYTVDETSPSQHGEWTDYEILSKVVPKKIA